MTGPQGPPGNAGPKGTPGMSGLPGLKGDQVSEIKLDILKHHYFLWFEGGL